MAIPMPPEKRGDMGLYIIPPILLVMLLLAIWPPRWSKPKWLQWLEKEHDDIKALLWEDARTRGKWEWQQQVRTQEGLEAWVEEVRGKHGMAK